MNSASATVVPHRHEGPRHVHRREPGRVSHHVGFWFAAVAFTVLMAFGTAPTPLWPLYAGRDGLRPTTVTVAFAMLVVGAGAGFLTLGHLSDRLGRRRIVVPALVFAIAAALLMAADPGVAGLLTGRLLDGVGVGLMSSTATAYLHDLYLQEHPGRPHSAVPSLVSSMATLGGLALGPPAAGAVAQWLPDPLVTTQAVFAVAMIACLGLVLATPETVDVDSRAGQASRRFGLRPGSGIDFMAVAGAGFVSFAVLGLISAVGSLVLRTELHNSSYFVAGLAPFLMFGAAAAGLLSIRRLDWRQTLVAGAVVLPAGLVAVAWSVTRPALAVYLIALIIAGAGAGALFKGAVGRSAALALPASRAGVLAVFFVVSYVGMGLPPVLFSVVAGRLGMSRALVAFAVALAVLGTAAVLLAVVRVRRAARRARAAR